MIPRDYITEWRAVVPWVEDAQVEQDLVISRALVEIFSHPHLGKELAFRGGTALHKLHSKRPARYSEDIDLVQVNAGPIGTTFNCTPRGSRFLARGPSEQSERRASNTELSVCVRRRTAAAASLKGGNQFPEAFYSLRLQQGSLRSEFSMVSRGRGDFDLRP